jgi:hypothetical protein
MTMPFLSMVLVGVFALSGCAEEKPTTTGGGTDTPKEKEASVSGDAVVESSDYAYKVTGKLKAGGTLQVRNVGKEFHMIGLGKLKPGKKLADLQAAFETEDEQDESEIAEEIGMPGNFMGPGSDVGITAPEGLEPGTYALICFLNVEGEQTPHFVKGMINEIEVVSGEGKTPEPDVTYQTAPGKPVTGPATLTAGKHVIEVDRSADGEGLEPGLFKLNDGATVQQFAEAIAIFDEGLPVDAASKLPGKIILGMFDYEDTTSVIWSLNLEPGKYVIVTQDSDQEDAPVVPVEVIEITVA